MATATIVVCQPLGTSYERVPDCRRSIVQTLLDLAASASSHLRRHLRDNASQLIVSARTLTQASSTRRDVSRDHLC